MLLLLLLLLSTVTVDWIGDATHGVNINSIAQKKRRVRSLGLRTFLWSLSALVVDITSSCPFRQQLMSSTQAS
jgi:ABC-type branched-subunit amino acid transport system permease subunit